MSANLVDYEAHSVCNGHLVDSSGSGEILIRRFDPDEDDERQMGELAFNNAFLGQPFDPVCPCKQWFSGAVLTPYINYQPEHIHVAVHKSSGRLIGYLTGSMGGRQFDTMQYDMVRQKVVSLAASLAMPWTLFDHVRRLFAAHVIFKGESERPNHPATGVHWHFQVDKEFRSQGIGTKLLQRFVNDAIRANFTLIWGEVMAYPQRPVEYFAARGWSIHDAKPTKIFRDLVDFPVQIACITKPLASFKALVRVS